jgi:predicted transcriptional regulator of viral defense system
MKTIPLETYVATCQQRSRVRLIGPDKYVLVPFGRLVLGYGPKGEYRISSKGKTLFDCIQKIRYVGDVGNLISLVNLMDYGDLSDFMYFAIRYGTTALKERAGYIIELSTKAKDKRTKELIKELRANISKWVVVRLKPDSPIQEKHYSRRWHVYDNIGLENAATRV